MHDLDSVGRTGHGTIAQALIWGGVLLLVIGGFLAYPYARSYLATVPTAPPTPSLSPTVCIPSPTSTQISSRPSSTPTVTPVPTPTPIPALPTRIVIPAIGVDAPIVPVSWYTVEVEGWTQAMWNLPDGYAAGWHETSATLGVPGNTVLNGHNATNGEVFRDLYKLDTDDEIVVYANEVPYTYTVAKMLILPEGGQPLEVRIQNAQYILPTDDERLTLVTCHPYGSLRNRLIVIAFPEAGDPYQ